MLVLAVRGAGGAGAAAVLTELLLAAAFYVFGFCSCSQSRTGESQLETLLRDRRIEDSRVGSQARSRLLRQRPEVLQQARQHHP